MAYTESKEAFHAIDFTTTEGAKLKRILLARLSEQRDKLDDPGLLEKDTALIRGAIVELKHLLKEAMPVAQVPSYYAQQGRE